MRVTKSIQSGCGLLMGTARSMSALFGQEARQRTQRGKNLCAVRLVNLATILIIRAIPDIVVAILDTPLTASDLQ